MKKTILAATFSVMVLVLVAIAEKPTLNTAPLSEIEINKFQYCGSDSDCVAVINGCCDCSQGGGYVAIGKSRLESFKASFDCLHAKCPEPDDTLCKEVVVSCVEHKCKVF